MAFEYNCKRRLIYRWSCCCCGPVAVVRSLKPCASGRDDTVTAAAAVAAATNDCRPLFSDVCCRHRLLHHRSAGFQQNPFAPAFLAFLLRKCPADIVCIILVSSDVVYMNFTSVPASFPPPPYRLLP